MSDKFVGAPYPITKTARGFFQRTKGVNSIRSDLLALFLTNPGERVMLPTYGLALNKFLFEPNDPTIAEAVREAVIQAINMWEPRITVEQIEVSNSIDDESLNPRDARQDTQHILSIKVRFFDPEDIQNVQELALEVPLAGG